jgi:hypothetical protein
MPAVEITQQPVYGIPVGRRAVSVSAQPVQSFSTSPASLTIDFGPVSILVVVSSVNCTGVSQAGVVWTQVYADTAGSSRTAMFVGKASAGASTTLVVTMASSGTTAVFLFGVSGISGLPDQVVHAASVVSVAVGARNAVMAVGVATGGPGSTLALGPKGQSWRPLWANDTTINKTSIAWRLGGPSTFTPSGFSSYAGELLANFS